MDLEDFRPFWTPFGVSFEYGFLQKRGHFLANPWIWKFCREKSMCFRKHQGHVDFCREKSMLFRKHQGHVDFS